MPERATRWARAIAITCLLTLISTAGLADTNHDQNRAKWTPDKGRLSSRHGTEDQHVIYHYFYWASDADMALLRDDGNETLEMDIVFNNVAPNSAWSTRYAGGTKGTHWDSNQPLAYLDTMAFDSNDYRSFTVGTAFANQLDSNTWYYWWTWGNHNSAGSRAGVEAQHGYRSTGCFLGYELCVFSDAGATLIWYQNNWPNEFSLPGECRYVYPRNGAIDPCRAW